jgi:NAD(P)-dependent dehydrogenase (short-subunit alcohol dehydrogenase family)
MAVRNLGKGRQALDDIRGEQPEAALEVRHLDLSDLDSVRSFVETVLADVTPVDVLINNAGIMMCPRSLTKQGFELQFATNRLAHFTLTGLLLGTMKGGSDARVVIWVTGSRRSTSGWGCCPGCTPPRIRTLPPASSSALTGATSTRASDAGVPIEPAKDPETARRLWNVSEQLTGVRFDLRDD